MAKANPSFQFYPSDWLVGTADLSHSSKATFLLLLCYEWTKVELAFDPPKLARMLGISEQTFNQDWKELQHKFTITDKGYLRNERLESIREEVLARREARQNAGRKGGLSKAKAKLKQKPSKGRLKSEDRRLKSEDIEEVVQHYQTHHPRARGGPDERKKIAARLKDGFTVEDLKLAIDGCHVSPYHCGQNGSGTKYQTLELIVRNASKVTQFIEAGARDGESNLSERSRRSLDAINGWLAKQNGAPV